ncbi:hypothetical protein [Kitasatospora herbaricolor]|uniref:Uncharacterized protein n=1 Tax=Kitasatospora herbaricolor TaxID=68217 RepID=A0ABZ1WK35_9ACTN|nr:hypothetical protein [Kitasatospora herbaricolor]
MVPRPEIGRDGPAEALASTVGVDAVPAADPTTRKSARPTRS